MKKLVKAYRNVFTAPPGHLLIECDLSQAELRIIAWMAKDKKMLEIYRMGGDIHTATAIAVLGITQEQWENYTKDEQDLFRFRAKAVNFGFCFSMGAAKYVGYAKTEYNIDVTERQAETIRNTYFNLYANLRGWHTGQRNLAARDRQVRALHGALRRLPSVDSSEESIKGEAMRQAINSPVQRFASDLGLIAMTRFGNCCPWDKFRPVAFIHDAVIVATKVAHAEEAMSAIKWFMQTPPLKKWFGLKTPIPILADVSIGATLGDMMERPDIEAKQPVWWDGN